MVYCPKCGSQLYPIDEKYIKEYGVCSYCVTYRRKSNEREYHEGNGLQQRDSKG